LNLSLFFPYIQNFANVAILPTIFKFNGVTNLSEIPEDIKNRYQWRRVTRAELDGDISVFIRNYPFDAFEGATRILNGRAARRKKLSVAISTAQNLRTNSVVGKNQQGRRGGFNRPRGGQFPTPAARQGNSTLKIYDLFIFEIFFLSLGTAIKRPFPATAPTNKRFRPDLNNSFPGANRGSVPIRNYAMEQYGYGRPVPYNNGNDRWPPRYPIDEQQQQQRPEFFERSNFELRPAASDNNRYYGDRPPHHMSGGNNYNHDRQSRFNEGSRGYDNQQSNYDPNFIRAVAQVCLSRIF
jgi:hypothetical protein